METVARVVPFGANPHWKLVAFYLQKVVLRERKREIARDRQTERVRDGQDWYVVSQGSTLLATHVYVWH